jgi:hypothetical protein
MTIETLGVDIAKNVFQLHGINSNGRFVLKCCSPLKTGHGLHTLCG